MIVLIVLIILVLLSPIFFLFRYELLASFANTILNILHIFSFVPHPRFESSHKLGIYSELDLYHHFKDVLTDKQKAILNDFHNGGRNGDLSLLQSYDPNNTNPTSSMNNAMDIMDISPNNNNNDLQNRLKAHDPDYIAAKQSQRKIKKTIKYIFDNFVLSALSITWAVVSRIAKLLWSGLKYSLGLIREKYINYRATQNANTNTSSSTTTTTPDQNQSTTATNTNNSLDLNNLSTPSPQHNLATSSAVSGDTLLLSSSSHRQSLGHQHQRDDLLLGGVGDTSILNSSNPALSRHSRNGTPSLYQQNLYNTDDIDPDEQNDVVDSLQKSISSLFSFTKTKSLSYKRPSQRFSVLPTPQLAPASTTPSNAASGGTVVRTQSSLGAINEANENSNDNIGLSSTTNEEKDQQPQQHENELSTTRTRGGSQNQTPMNNINNNNNIYTQDNNNNNDNNSPEQNNDLLSSDISGGYNKNKKRISYVEKYRNLALQRRRSSAGLNTSSTTDPPPTSSLYASSLAALSSMNAGGLYASGTEVYSMTPQNNLNNLNNNNFNNENIINPFTTSQNTSNKTMSLTSAATAQQQQQQQGNIYNMYSSSTSIANDEDQYNTDEKNNTKNEKNNYNKNENFSSLPSSTLTTTTTPTRLSNNPYIKNDTLKIIDNLTIQRILKYEYDILNVLKHYKSTLSTNPTSNYFLTKKSFYNIIQRFALYQSLPTQSTMSLYHEYNNKHAIGILNNELLLLRSHFAQVHMTTTTNNMLNITQNINNTSSNNTSIITNTNTTTQPLLLFRFVNYTTIYLVSFQFAFIKVGSKNNKNNNKKQQQDQQLVLPSDSNLLKNTPYIENRQLYQQQPQLNNTNTEKINTTNNIPTINIINQNIIINKDNQDNETANDIDDDDSIIQPYIILTTHNNTKPYNVYEMITILNSYKYDQNILQQLLIHQYNIYQQQIQYNIQPSTSSTTSTTSTTTNTISTLYQPINNNNNIITSSINNIYTKQQLQLDNIIDNNDQHNNNLTTPSSSSSSSPSLINNTTISNNNNTNNITLLKLYDLSHSVPGRRKSLYTRNDNKNETIEKLNTIITTSLHHSLFFSCIIDTEIYDFICFTTIQRDMFVKDLQNIVLLLMNEYNTQNNNQNTNNDNQNNENNKNMMTAASSTASSTTSTSTRQRRAVGNTNTTTTSGNNKNDNDDSNDNDNTTTKRTTTRSKSTSRRNNTTNTTTSSVIASSSTTLPNNNSNDSNNNSDDGSNNNVLVKGGYTLRSRKPASKLD